MDSVTRFGGEVSADLDETLTRAAESRGRGEAGRAEQLLLSAIASDPGALPSYFALYKFYFYGHRLADAERIVLAALGQASSQSGISADWRKLTKDSADWNDTAGPAHFYMFSLKALAFIRLRLHRPDEAQELLDKLAELDTVDGTGASTIRALAKGAATH